MLSVYIKKSIVKKKNGIAKFSTWFFNLVSLNTVLAQSYNHELNSIKWFQFNLQQLDSLVRLLIIEKTRNQNMPMLNGLIVRFVFQSFLTQIKRR